MTESFKKVVEALQMPRAIDDEKWVYWQCWKCGEETGDPAAIEETTCSSGHQCYLGPVGSDDHRRAFPSKRARSEADKEQRGMHAMLKVIFRDRLC